MKQRITLVHEIDVGIRRLLIRQPDRIIVTRPKERDKRLLRIGPLIVATVGPCQQMGDAAIGIGLLRIDSRKGDQCLLLSQPRSRVTAVAIQP